jgi:hypothetical protein
MSENGITFELSDSKNDKEKYLSANELVKWRGLNEKEINELTNKLDSLHKTNTVINKELWKKCDHKWCSVDGATDGDLCNKYCKTCKLYNVCSLYT